jgi:membrane protein
VSAIAHTGIGIAPFTREPMADTLVEGEGEGEGEGGERGMIGTLWSAAKAWLDERCLSHSAGIAFYTVLSLSPFLVLALAAASFLVDGGMAISQVRRQLGSLVGPEAADLVATMVSSANETRYSGVAAMVALGATLFGATAAVAELKAALDSLFCEPEARGLMRRLVRVRLVALVAALALGFVIVATLVASSLLTAFIGSLGVTGDLAHALALAGNEVVSLAVVTGAFYGLLRFVPGEPLPRRATLIGAVTAALLFEVARFGIAAYIRHATVIKAYGAAGALVVLMLWVYYVTAMFLYGALVAREHVARHAAQLQTRATGAVTTALASVVAHRRGNASPPASTR